MQQLRRDVTALCACARGIRHQSERRCS